MRHPKSRPQITAGGMTMIPSAKRARGALSIRVKNPLEGRKTSFKVKVTLEFWVVVRSLFFYGRGSEHVSELTAC